MTKHNRPADDSSAISVVVPRDLKRDMLGIADDCGDTLSSVVRSALVEYRNKYRKVKDGEVQG